LYLYTFEEIVGESLERCDVLSGVDGCFGWRGNGVEEGIGGNGER
jgi:hypothetical protein